MNIEKQLKEINAKLGMLLEANGLKATIKHKIPPIPDIVDLTENEKKITKVIYNAGEDGIHMNKICEELNMRPSTCVKLIRNIMRKGVPIENDVFTDYRFDKKVLEAQEKRNFLGF
jgi:DNA-binding MarR family transcriptional regulator